MLLFFYSFLILVRVLFHDLVVHTFVASCRTTETTARISLSRGNAAKPHPGRTSTNSTTRSAAAAPTGTTRSALQHQAQHTHEHHKISNSSTTGSTRSALLDYITTSTQMYVETDCLFLCSKQLQKQLV